MAINKSKMCVWETGLIHFLLFGAPLPIFFIDAYFTIQPSSQGFFSFFYTGDAAYLA